MLLFKPFPPMTVLKKSFLILSVFFIVTSFALWLLAKTIKPETIKHIVTSQLTALTHKPGKINGTISWQIFPRPGVKITQIEVGDEKINSDYSFSIDTLLVNLKIRPLLRGQFVFSDVSIDGAKIIAHPDNFDSSKTSTTTAKATAVAPSNNERFAIDRFMLTHSQVTLKQNDSIVTIKNIQLGLEQFNMHNSFFPLQLKGSISAKFSKNTVNADLNFKGNLALPKDTLQLSDATIQKLGLNGHLNIKNLLCNQLKINTITTHLKKDKNTMFFNPFSVSLYHGMSIGDVQYQINTKKISINQTATNINGQQLMKHLGGGDILRGSLDYSIHAALPISQMNELSGKGNLTIREGEFVGINLHQLIDDTTEKMETMLSGNELTLKNSLQLGQFNIKEYREGTTPFSLASIQYHFAGENLIMDTLILQTEKLQLKGEGNLNLKTQDLSSRLQAAVNSASESKAISKIQTILGGSFPITIAGTLSNPAILPDLKIINPVLSHYLIKTTLQKPVKEIEKQLKSLFH